ncbi:DUF6632 domain-containing protein [Ferrimonas balearica]|uniref:DUF6632 domain-containing protein n=1 Tax=Ferrimonas balearica TaxID=44012 RepID=UPI001F1E7EE1|nr:DUF6632 domain-containing protein [Ferrimonas balearica]MBY6016797.1 hypothetical protein [Halomonas denitrificans]MBY6094910.1 hypothetical protein [Ferrimonas balearica]
MSAQARLRILKWVLRVAGLIMLFGWLPLSLLWPSGWGWYLQTDHLYFEVLLGVYATLGVFLIWAASDPLAHRSLIWFTAWSSLVHGGVMTWQALRDPSHFGHFWGDVPALLVLAVLIFVLMPKHGWDLS